MGWKKVFDIIYDDLYEKCERWRLKQIERILCGSPQPSYYDSDVLFQDLCQRYPARKESYGWDYYSLWSRASKRMEDLFRSLPGMRLAPKKILDVGAGDGVLGFLLSCYGHEVLLLDYEDWRHPVAAGLPFLKADLNESDPGISGEFDFIVSYNTLEHLDNPQKVLADLYGLCRPGGEGYLEFGPIYYGPWGMHLEQTIGIPYCHYLFSEAFLRDKLRKTGIFDLGRQVAEPQPLNRWKASAYEEAVRDSGFEVVRLERYWERRYLHVIKEFPAAFSYRVANVEDLTTQGFSILLRRPV